jgi:hypothetical protein
MLSPVRFLLLLLSACPTAALRAVATRRTAVLGGAAAAFSTMRGDAALAEDTADIRDRARQGKLTVDRVRAPPRFLLAHAGAALPTRNRRPPCASRLPPLSGASMLPSRLLQAIQRARDDALIDDVSGFDCAELQKLVEVDRKAAKKQQAKVAKMEASVGTLVSEAAEENLQKMIAKEKKVEETIEVRRTPPRRGFLGPSLARTSSPTPILPCTTAACGPAAHSPRSLRP